MPVRLLKTYYKYKLIWIPYLYRYISGHEYMTCLLLDLIKSNIITTC